MATVEADNEIDDANEEKPEFVETLKKIPKLINQEDVVKMIGLQVTAIDRLENTNKNLINCNNLAQSKLAATTKLYKKTTKQMKEAKKDLDTIYKKLIDLKTKIRSERPDLFAAERQMVQDDEESEEIARVKELPSSSREKVQTKPTNIERKSSRQE